MPTTATIYTVSRTLTSAEVLALNTSPVTLVAGQAGKLILPLRAAIIYRPGQTPYTIDGNPDFYLQHGDLNLYSQLIAAVGIIDQPTTAFFAGPVGTAVASDVAPFVGLPLRLQYSPGEPTGGDGTIEVTIDYQEVPI